MSEKTKTEVQNEKQAIIRAFDDWDGRYIGASIPDAMAEVLAKAAIEEMTPNAERESKRLMIALEFMKILLAGIPIKNAETLFALTIAINEEAGKAMAKSAWRMADAMLESEEA